MSKKVGGKRNFGWGRSMKWAISRALDHSYGHGKFGTAATHKNHMINFVNWLKVNKINDLKSVSKETLSDYAKDVANSYSNNYARNLISSANIVMMSVRQDSKMWIAPSAYLDRRKSARDSAPPGLSLLNVERAAAAISKNGQPRVGAVIYVARLFGLRLKEAILLDLRNALREAQKYDAINIVVGTKGGRGRNIDRWVPVTQQSLSVLAQAHRNFGQKLIPRDTDLKTFMRLVKAQWRLVRDKFDLGKIHDLRAAYACSEYQQLTGHKAPACNEGIISAPAEIDRAARDKIIDRLGHGHRGRMSPYVGRGRK